MWGPTLLVLVLVPKITPEYAAFLMIFVNLAGVLGRFSITALIEPMGRRASGTLYCILSAILMVAAGYLYDVYVFGWSLFYILMVAQGFFGSAVYTVVGPYMAEIWPARLRASGMGLSYGVGNCGKTRASLVAASHKIDLVAFVQSVEERKKAFAGYAKCAVDAVRDQSIYD